MNSPSVGMNRLALSHLTRQRCRWRTNRMIIPTIITIGSSNEANIGYGFLRCWLHAGAAKIYALNARLLFRISFPISFISSNFCSKDLKNRMSPSLSWKQVIHTVGIFSFIQACVVLCRWEKFGKTDQRWRKGDVKRMGNDCKGNRRETTSWPKPRLPHIHVLHIPQRRTWAFK